jgi:hypothetical protein
MASRATKFVSLLLQGLRTDANSKVTVPLTIQAVSGQTANLLEMKNAAGSVLASFSASGVPTLPSLSVTEDAIAASSAIGLGVLRVAHAKYSFGVDGGVTGLITPASTAVIPAKAIMIGGTVNVTTAVTSLGSATLSVGTSAGSSASALLAATAKASLGAAAIVNAVPTLAVPVKMSAAGSITVTVGTADLTAGVVEIFIYYVVATA